LPSLMKPRSVHLLPARTLADGIPERGQPRLLRRHRRFNAYSWGTLRLRRTLEVSRKDKARPHTGFNLGKRDGTSVAHVHTGDSCDSGKPRAKLHVCKRDLVA
jgi:hypothetical protein